MIIFFGTTHVKYKPMILLYVLGTRLQKKFTMSHPVSDQHAPVGRKNVLDPESKTKFPHTVVSSVDSCATPRNWKRKDYFLPGPFRPSVRRIQYSDCTQIAQSSPTLLIRYDDVFVNCNWVVTRWQKYSTHLHINNT